MKKLFTLFVAGSLTCHYSNGQSKVPIDDVSKHIGEIVTVCDKVYGGKFLENSKSQPTLLNMGGEVPRQKLTVVINPDDRKKFAGKPEETFTGKNVCVTGKLVDYKGKPEIVISNPDEIHSDGGGGGLEIRTKDFLPFQ
jgi:micrococcal nuclease